MSKLDERTLALFDALDRAGCARNPAAARKAAMDGISILELERIRRDVAPGCQVHMQIGAELTDRNAELGCPAATMRKALASSGKPPTRAQLATLARLQKAAR